MNRNSVIRNISESNAIGVDLLISDCRMGLTLLDMAETTDLPENRSRRIEEAHHAYDTVVHFLQRLSPSGEQGRELKASLTKLADRLRAAGVTL